MVSKEELESFFDKIGSENYLIMRNYDNLLDDINSGGDIDILCENRNSFVNIAQVQPINKEKECYNYLIKFGELTVPIDIRFLGDGYYCDMWELEMLNNRKKYKFYYVMNDEDYKFSILYHCIYHKRVIPNKYLDFLEDCFGSKSSKELLKCLRKYLKEKKYKVCKPCDKGVYFNKKKFWFI